MPSPLFITAREFICYATEYYHTPSTVNLAKFLARKVQLQLTLLPDRAWTYVDRIEDMLLGETKATWKDFESNLIAFASYIQTELKE